MAGAVGHDARDVPWLGARWSAASLSACLLAAVAAGCSEGPGETRPNVEVIGGGGSVSVSGVVEGYGEPLYFPVTDQALNLAIGMDLRDMRVLMAAANQSQAGRLAGRPRDLREREEPDRGGRSTRSLASLAKDGIIRDALTGKGRAAGLGDNARRLIVDRGVQALQYGLAMESLRAAQERMDAGSGSEAAAAIDAGWATLAGPRETTMPNDGLLATAVAREEDFVLAGRLARPLEAHLFQAQVAAQQGDAEAVREALDASRGYLNTIFYLSVLRDAKVLAGDSRATDRETHLAEGWTFFQALRAQVATASPDAAATIEAAFTRRSRRGLPRRPDREGLRRPEREGRPRGAGDPGRIPVHLPRPMTDPKDTE